ncbi:hypothetical protein A3F03_00230 [Candidatus Roizmanbacteria bacterium RIFCSPHIGHO2_12_FULL_41_11]|uniref:PDZ domain-containing protein n=2 Tax=Candidatus Roizmaniibacteriota TaxID=1752723 RepID=A0A1F7J9S6_9BACT|nr:MAG: hypothetical protein A3F03_00230 [Candidatus Roizmanbacteria bacterium RIFCSPHIGHO2_12_FULL_41_11]OGK52393.1 MAG: hypothetical protein A2966_01860 [Candidatus Roizmanbacteria bacterium RIFCSPLOWO2_01_FULL_41_22]
MKSNKLTNILLYLSVAIFLFGVGYKTGEYQTKNSLRQLITYSVFTPNNKQTGQTKTLDFSLFWDTWEKIENKYVDKKKIDPKKMYYGAIKGLVASLDDPYTFFLTPEENKITKDSLDGKYEGIGAQLGLKENRIVIIAPLKNSPAEKAGLKSGDIVAKVDGKSTKGWNLYDAVSRIRGTKGTKVILTVERVNEDKPLDVPITRQELKAPSVELSYEKLASCQKECATVANLKLTQFGDDTVKEWNKSVDEIALKWKNKEISGMVLDLRDNPGGYLESSVDIASEFLPEGKLIVSQKSTDASAIEYNVTRKGRLINIPMVVLINKGSASASEILSGALRDHKRAVLVGEKSFGKGSVQQAFDLQEGAGVHVTIAKWILPKGDWINGKGIEPNIVVENQLDGANTLTPKTDLQLQKAVGLVAK